MTSLALNRLGEREAAAIIARLVGNKELPADVMAEIVERTDGIPLFVEEMTKAVLEAESEGATERDGRRYPIHRSVAVPASLHASLMARLDRLGSAKEVAQIGAAIGREFSHALIGCGSRASRRQNSDLRSTVSLRQVCCSGRVCPARDLSFQACSGAGRGLRHIAARAETRASRSHRRNSREPVRGDCREPAGVAGASLHRGWPDREGCGPVGQSGTAVAGALGAG